MSNVDVVNRVYAGFAAGDIKAVVATFAEPRRVSWSASAAHSAIAVNERAPASTAHSASPTITASR